MSTKQLASLRVLLCSTLVIFAWAIIGPCQCVAGIGVPGPSLRAEAQTTAAGNSPAPDVDTANNPAVAFQQFTNLGATSTASAEATYGSLRASGSVDKPLDGDPNNFETNFNFATGRAMFSDLLTISGGAGNGMVVFSFQVTGTLDELNAGDLRATASFNFFRPAPYFDGANGFFSVESGTSRTLNETIVSLPLEFTYDTPFLVEATLEAAASLEFNDIGTATANLLNTAVLTSIVVDGMPGATISSASGTTYGIPEPTTLALLAMALATLTCRRAKV